MLDHLAPDIADDLEYQRLLDQERRAAAATRLTLRRRGDGSADLHGGLATTLTVTVDYETLLNEVGMATTRRT